MKLNTSLRVIASLAVAATTANGHILLKEDFEQLDVSTTSSVQFGATIHKNKLPDGGNWVGSTQGFGSDRKGMIHKSFGDYTAPSGNNQGYYFGYTNTGITSSESAISHTLEAGVTYTVSFDVARDNNKTTSNYLMELVAFGASEGDIARRDVRAGVKPGTVLAFVTGVVEENEMVNRRIFTFEADPVAHASLLGQNIGLRFVGNSSCPILDNVLLTAKGLSFVDTDEDGLPDDWEIAHFGDLSRDGTGDFDEDGLSDALEYEANLDPTKNDTNNDGHPDWVGVQGYLSVEKWDGIAGTSLTDLFTTQAFHDDADEWYYASEAKAVSDAGDNYGLRMTGTIIAPMTGQYQFWIAGGGEARLYVSTDSTIFNRRLIASVDGATGEESWEEQPEQQSAQVGFVAGRQYFIEILMKAGTAPDHVAVAWQYPGQTRQVIPGTYLKSFTPDPDDLDGDGMRDSWEILVGLDPNDNGFTDLDQSGYANIDGDDLLNFEEYIHGRNPFISDSPEGLVGYSEWQQFAIGFNNGLVSALTNHPLFAQNASSAEGVYEGAKSPLNVGNHFGRRMRGVITIPTTGTYHFYVSGDESASLLMNPSGPSRFGKFHVAHAQKSPVFNFTQQGTQKSPAFALIQGDRVYFEVLHVEGIGEDHCAVGWSGPPSTTPVVIPALYVSTPITETILVNDELVDNDADNDSLPDDWELVHGLLVTNEAGDASDNGEYGDPDGDGLTNYEEYLLGTHPLVANGVPHKWRHEIYTRIGGDRISTLTGPDGILKGPSFVRLADSTEDFRNYADSYGQRFRATIMPPESGDYTFWVSGDDSVELWLSTDDRKFRKRRIAYVDDRSFSGYSNTGFREWDKAPGQRSAPVTLVGSESYFIEVLHKEWGGDDHVSVAWALGSGPASFASLPDFTSGVAVTFSNIDLGDVTHVTGTVGGQLQTAPVEVVGHHLANDGTTATVQLQWIEGNETRAVKVRFDVTAKGIAASQVWSRSADGDVIGEDFEQLAETTTLAIGDAGLAVTALALSGVEGRMAFSRVPLPSSVLTSFIFDADDKDDDYLPDAWEDLLPGASASNDNGLINPDFGEYGDPDADLLVNRVEWLLGTHPNNPDTDGDGYSDGQEVYFLGTNPLVPEFNSPEAVGSVQIDAEVASSGTWVPTADGGMLSMENRGWIEYQITIDQEGFYVFEIRGRARGSGIFPHEHFPLEIHINSGNAISTMLTSVNGEQGVTAGFAGWLGIGTHTIRVLNNNLLGRRTLQLDSIRLLLPAGVSTTILGLPDWVYDFLSARSTIATTESGSFVSPLCIEGESRDWAATTFSVNGSTVQPVEKGTNNRWYANITLDPDAPVDADVQYEAGLLEHTLSFEWYAYNVASGLPIKLRIGDSLRLTAHSPGFAPDDSGVSFTLDGQPIGTTTADSPMGHAFHIPGTFTLEASYTAEGGSPQTATVMIEVVDADFGSPLSLYLNRSRAWNLPGVPWDLELEADDSVVFGPDTPNGTGRTLVVDATRTGTNTVIARSAPQGSIVAAGRIEGLLMGRSSDHQAAEVFVYANGDRIVEFTMFASSLPQGGHIKLELYLGGRLFVPGGTTTLILDEVDFGENGIARFRVLLSSGVGHACHRTYLYDANGNLVGQM